MTILCKPRHLNEKYNWQKYFQLDKLEMMRQRNRQLIERVNANQMLGFKN